MWLEEVAAEIEGAGGVVVALAGDVGEEGVARALVELAVSKFGGLDIAFNNAGALGAMGPTAEVSSRDWEEALKVNLSSAFYAARAQIPAMRSR